MCREYNGNASAAAGKIQLSPSLIDYHRRGIRQIETAALRLHWQAQDAIGAERREQCRRQAAGFRPEHQGIAGLVGGLDVMALALGTYAVDVQWTHLVDKGLPIFMDADALP